MDVQGGIRSGQEFARAIDSALNACQAVLVVIGRDWATCTAKDGQRRLDDPKDWTSENWSKIWSRLLSVVLELPDPATETSRTMLLQ
jgi:hypothetical protein